MLFREHNHSYIITPLSPRRFIPAFRAPPTTLPIKMIIAIIILFKHHCNNHLI